MWISHNQKVKFLGYSFQTMRSNVADYSLYILKIWLKDTASLHTVSQKEPHTSPCRAFDPTAMISIILSKPKAEVWLVCTWNYFLVCTNLQLLTLLEQQLTCTHIMKTQIRCLVSSEFFQSPDPLVCYMSWPFCSHWHESEKCH